MQACCRVCIAQVAAVCPIPCGLCALTNGRRVWNNVWISTAISRSGWQRTCVPQPRLRVSDSTGNLYTSWWICCHEGDRTAAFFNRGAGGSSTSKFKRFSGITTLIKCPFSHILGHELFRVCYVWGWQKGKFMQLPRQQIVDKTANVCITISFSI